MTMSAVTVATASRDPEVLAQSGRFQLRRLAEQLDMWPDEAAKTAFMSLSNAAMAQTVAAKLKEEDAKGGGKAPAASAPATNGAVQQQQQAPAETPATPPPAATKPAKRQPTTPSDPGPGAAVGNTDAAAQVVASLQSVVNGLTQLTKDLQTASQSSEQSAANSQQVKEQVSVLIGELEKLNPWLTATSGALKGIVQMQCTGLALNLLLAEQVLGASRTEVLQAAIADSAELEKQLFPGAAPGKG